jgi:hypothetical protein
MATATFNDQWFGAVRVKLVTGRNGKATWQAIGGEYINPGYRAVPASRAIANARKDARFTEVSEA